MSPFFVKSVLALVFVAAGSAAALAMFALMGRSEHKTSPMTLRRLHRAMGYVFVVLLVVTTVLCVRYVAQVGDRISVRAALHGVLAVLLIGVLAVKIVIVRWFKGLLNVAPALGVTVLVLAVAVAATSAGYFFVRLGAARGVDVAGVETASGVAVPAGGDADRGRGIFEENCSACHAADSDESGFGPGLKGLFRNDKLPASGRAATVGNVVGQLREPVGMMPSFSSVAGQDLADLVEYLKTL